MTYPYTNACICTWICNLHDEVECTQTSFLPVYSVENIFLCTCKQEEDRKYFIFYSSLLNIIFKVTDFLFSVFHGK